MMYRGIHAAHLGADVMEFHATAAVLSMHNAGILVRLVRPASHKVVIVGQNIGVAILGNVFRLLRGVDGVVDARVQFHNGAVFGRQLPGIQQPLCHDLRCIEQHA